MPKKGYKQTEEHKRNVSKSSKGRKVWNEGKTKETDERVAKSSKLISKSLIGNKRTLGYKYTKKQNLKKSEGMKKWWKENKNSEKVFERNKKISKSKNGIKREIFSKEWRKNLSIGVSNAILKGKMKKKDTYKCGYFFSKLNNKKFWYRSLYELAAYILLDDEDSQNIIKEWKTECLKIPYKFNKIKKHTIPDIFVEYKSGKKQIVNIKPERRLNDILNILENKATQKYCSKNNIVFSIWTEKELDITKEYYNKLLDIHESLVRVIK